jgi:hypothetical protein
MEPSFANRDYLLEKFGELTGLQEAGSDLRDLLKDKVEELARTKRTRGSCHFVIIYFSFSFWCAAANHSFSP